MKNNRYDAFISYRHAELDKFVAMTLERKLESFKIPRSVKIPEGRKRNIERVFRDQDELPVSSNLSDQITLALENTEYLLVICTPRLPQSEWCLREIDTFIKLHGRDKILAVLAEGEPEESFPKSLTQEEYIETGSDGSQYKNMRYFEPLAADVRGENKREIKKAMDDAVLRIAASMYDINYDDLKQRHKERKIKRLFSIVSAVACAFMLFSAVCVGLMTKIIRQSDMIMDQNTEIKQQNEEIEAKNTLIKKQYHEAATNLSIMTAEKSYDLSQKGRNLDAIYMLRQVLPDDKNDEDLPYTPEAEAALADALNVYVDNETYIYCTTYNMEATIQQVRFSPSYERILIVDSGNNVRVFDLETADILFSKALPLNNISLNDIYFCNNDNFIVSETDGIHKISLSQETDTIIPSPKDPSKNLKGFLTKSCSRANDCSLYLCEEGNDVYLMDYDDSLVFTFNAKDLGADLNFGYTINSYVISPDQKYTAITLGNYSENKSSLIVIDNEAGEIIGNESFDEKYSLDCFYFYGHNLYFVDTGDFNDFFNSCYTIHSYDCDERKILWSNTQDEIYNNLLISSNGNYLMCSGTNHVSIFDPKTGTKLNTSIIDDYIINTYRFEDSDLFFIATDKGWNYNLDPESCVYVNYLSTNYYDDNPNTIDKTAANTKGLFVHYDKANYLTRFNADTDLSNYRTVYPIDHNFQEINYTGEYYISYNTWDSLESSIFDSKTGEIIYAIDESNYSTEFLGDGTQYVVSYSLDTKIYDFKNNKLYSIEDKLLTTSYDGAYGLFKNYENDYYSILSLPNQKKEYEFKISEEYGINPSVFLLDKDHFVLRNNETNLITVAEITSSGLKPMFSKFVGSDDNICCCKFDNAFTIIYNNGTVEFYKNVDGEYVLDNTLFNISKLSLPELRYYPEQDIYFLTGSNSYMLNSDFEITARFRNRVNYFSRENMVGTVSASSDVLYLAPLYSYEDLIGTADKRLSGYCPPANILKEYNIVPK